MSETGVKLDSVKKRVRRKVFSISKEEWAQLKKVVSETNELLKSISSELSKEVKKNGKEVTFDEHLQGTTKNTKVDPGFMQSKAGITEKELIEKRDKISEANEQNIRTW